LVHCVIQVISRIMNKISEKVQESGRARCPTYEKSAQSGILWTRTYAPVGRAPSPAKGVSQNSLNKKIWLVFIFSIFLFKLGHAGIGDWTTYTNKNDVQEVVLRDEVLWCATTGGVVVLDTQNGTITQLTNVDGLGGNHLSSVALDSSESLWLGAQNGTLTKFDFKRNQWDVYYNFISEQRTSSVKEIVADEEKLWVGSDVGVSVFYPDKSPHGEITETYRRLGDLNAEVDVNSIHLVGDRIWVGTEKGVAFAPKDYRMVNLMDPKNWTSFTKESCPDLTDDYVYTITDMVGEILIGTNQGVFKFNSVDSSWDSFGLGNRRVKDLKYIDGRLTACTDGGMFVRENGGWRELSNTGLLTTNLNSVAVDDSGFFWVGTADKGIASYDGDQWEDFIIDGPPVNTFLDMELDEQGRIWCAQGGGASCFDGSKWSSLDSVPEIDKHLMVAVEKDKEDNLWFSSWGGGVMKLHLPDMTWYRYTEKNSPLRGVAENHAYVVVNDITVDEIGNRWFPNWEAWDTTRVLCVPAYKDTFLVYYESDSIITSILMLKAKATAGHLYICFRDLGLLDYDYNWTVEDKTDDKFTHFTQTEHRLSANTVTSVDVDKNGTLWVGTSAGLDTFDSEWGRFRKVILPDPLGPQVTAMAVDERNNKWIGTESGLGMINSWGEFEHVLTTFNSKICNNEINGIKIDEKSGEVWIGTENGLSRYESGIAPAKNLVEVTPYPNPFVIRDGTEKLTFDRLPYQVKIKIYTVAGELVREINSGDKWDGRNKAGELVSGGIYLFYLSDPSGKKAVGKIAVIRE
jgi:ligand-binding sensor domain-containing protein